jgi:hypothetical protein
MSGYGRPASNMTFPHLHSDTENDLVAVVDGEAMVLRLGETKVRKEHQPTKAEMKARADWEERQQKWPSIYDRDRQHWRSWDHVPSGRPSLTLTDPLKSQWESGHLLGRWHDRKAKSIEAHLDVVLIGMLTGAAIVRHNRIAAETAQLQRQEAHEAHLREQERLRYEAQVDAFMEKKADEFVRLQKILSFRDYFSTNRTAAASPEENAILGAADDLIGRLRLSLSAEVLRQAVKLTD